MRLYRHELQSLGDLDSTLVSAIYKLNYLDDVNTSLQDLIARARVLRESWNAKGRYFFSGRPKNRLCFSSPPITSGEDMALSMLNFILRTKKTLF